MSTNPRYLLASNGIVTYGIETNAYEQETDPSAEFGLTSEDIDPPNSNPHTAMPTGGGRRGPYVNSPDPRDHEFDVPVVAHNPDVPLECALGARQTIDDDIDGDGTDERRIQMFTEADRLPTMTVRHVQEDADLVAYYVGCKANLDLSWSQGDPLEMSLGLTAARHEYDPAEAAPTVDPSLDQSVSPYRAHMAGTVTMEDPGDGTVIKEVATTEGGDLSWDNGLEAQHHGDVFPDGADTDGREAYSVAETTSAEKYDHSLDLNITDADLYERAAKDRDPVRVQIPFVRETLNGDIVDGVLVELEDTTITDAPMANPAEGVVADSVSLQPRTTEIQIIEPL